MKNSFKNTFAVLFFLLGLAQCGDQAGLSKKVKFKLVPDNPVVVKADLSRGGDFDEIKGPWFLMGSRVYNGTANRLYLVNYDLDGTTTNKGKMVTFKISLDPSADPCDERGYLAIIDSLQTYERLGSLCDPSDIAAGGTGANRYEQWYYSALPESDSSIYSIEVVANGWFTDTDDVPIERLYLTSYVVTQ